MTTLFWNTRLFGYILNVLDIIRKMGFQYYFPHRTSHPGALHLTIKLPDEQSCPPVYPRSLRTTPCDTADMMRDEPLSQHMNPQFLITVNAKP